MGEPDIATTKLLTAQQRFSDYIGNFIVNTTKSKAAANLDVADIDNRLGLLEEYWNDFKERDDILQEQATKLATLPYFADDMYITTLNRFLDAKHWATAKRKDLEAAAAPARATATNTAVNTRSSPSYSYLQKVTLPTFSSDQRQWDLFKDKFTALIKHDENIPAIIKFEKLSESVAGEAKQIIDGFPPIAANFETAWKALCSRFDNQVLRFNTHMHAITQLPGPPSTPRTGVELEVASHFSTLLSTVKQAINIFTAMERPVDQWGDIFVYCIESKLAPETRKDWVRKVESFTPKRFPTFDEMKEFLEERLRTLDLLRADADSPHQTESQRAWQSHEKPGTSSSSHSSKGNSNKPTKTTAHVATPAPTQPSNPRKCSLCSGGHLLAHCRNFQDMEPSERKQHVFKAKLCYNCLSPKHMTDACTSQNRCFVCNGKHHTRLHVERASETKSASNSGGIKTAHHTTVEPSSPSNPRTSSNSCHASTVSKTVLLSTACITLESPEGYSITVRALLDSGSQESFISEHIVQALHLRKRPANVAITGVGGEMSAVARSRVGVTIKTPLDESFSLPIEALVLTKLTSILPPRSVDHGSWPHLQNLQLADPHFGKPSRVDCILSSAVYGAILRDGLRQGAVGTPTALFSVFGWLVMGAASTSTARDATVLAHHICVDEKLTAALTRFWESEEIPKKNHQLSAEEEQCYAHFKSTHRRNEEGRFEVRLPFKGPPQLSGTRQIATSCFERLERRFKQKPELATAYRAFMKEYEDLQHMERVTREEADKPFEGCYLTHHAVFKSLTKIRVVFNASQKDVNGRTFNDFSHIGPKLQKDIFNILIAWCFLQYVFTCDVVKMFRQFLVHPDDADWQRILWRSNDNEPVESYRLSTVTYGTACAPFLSNACMLQLADDEQQQYPVAAEILRKGRYADDFFAGGGTLEEAVHARDELMKILESAGMSVGKWAANDDIILSNHEECSDKETSLDQGADISTLGVRWNPKKDVFYFKVTISGVTAKITKRMVLSDIARLFDPIGWLSPVIVRAKLLLQNLWLQGVNWDELLSPSMLEAWQEYVAQLQDLELIEIPRWFGTNNETTWEMHGFSDASERAYAAVVYLRTVVDGKPHLKFITAKSRVSPIKVISLPKLELCGAVLLTQLILTILEDVPTPPERIFCWTDSRIVLDWLKSHPSRWKAFVGNRASKIISTLPNACWQHVRSADNPADLATRGTTPRQLRDNSLWWTGPAWLQLDETQWPVNHEESPTHTQLEARALERFQAFVAQTTEETQSWLESFSSLDKLVRIFAYILRWRTNSRLRPEDRRKTWFSALELAAGRTALLQLVQRRAYSNETRRIQREGSVSPSSSLIRLTPFIDAEGLLRAGGRLQNAFLSESEKHPIILPASHHVTKLIISQAHRVTLHGGTSLTQSHLGRKYWIPRGRNFIRSIVRSCVTCARHNATTQQQLMGSLPAYRLQPSRPFTYTGLDYAGPFMIRASPGRGYKAYKGYAAIFVCMVVKAVHIEIVSSLTTEFNRFTARRGLCKIIYSDNGTTFQGADAELRRLFDQASAFSQEAAAAVAKDGVEWTYIPPRAPNFGGLWESNVKLYKRHLIRSIGEHKLTYEEFSTVAARIEACINSRPISPISSNEEDVAALTPGHFLIGSALTSPPEPFDEVHEPKYAGSRWRLLMLMRNNFWKRWQKEYLTHLQGRPK